MKIDVIAIGDELLSGFVINQNASFISRELFNNGFQVDRHLVLPDNEKTLRLGLEQAIQQSSCVICTGGLGPTCDDRTREIAADLFHEKLEFSEELAEKLKTTFKHSQSLNNWLEDQSKMITHSIIIPNFIGSASGFILTRENKTLILLPGVPSEMKEMLINFVLPYLFEHFSSERKFFGKWIHLNELQESQVDPLLRDLKTRYPTIDFGIYPYLGYVSVFIKTTLQEEKELLKPLKEIQEQFKTHIFESPNGTLEGAVHNLLTEKKLTISSAESCTGGAFAERLTQMPGASKYFLGSIVAYDNRVKHKVLGVSEKTLREKGAVSAETAREMLTGLLSLTQSDYGLAVTGIAGPAGGTDEKPVGTVWAALGRQGDAPYVWQIPTFGTREMIIEKSVNALLGALLNKLQSNNEYL